MSKRLRLSAEAETDLDEAVAWYGAQHQPGLGERFLDAVKATLRELAENPKLGSPPPGVADADARRLLVRTFPYAVVYYETSTEIRVIAVAHGRRRPGYWQGRE